MSKAIKIFLLGLMVIFSGVVNALCMKNKYFAGAGMGINSTPNFDETAISESDTVLDSKHYLT